MLLQVLWQWGQLKKRIAISTPLNFMIFHVQAQQFCQQLEAERSGASNSVVEEGSRAAAFYDGLPDDDVDADEDEGVTTGETTLMK